MLKKTGFRFKMILYNIIIMIAIVIVIIGLFYQYVVTGVRERSNQDFEIIISKSVTQYENLLSEMDKTALQIAANPSIVKYFQKVERDADTNYFTKEPVIAAELIKLLNSYNFKNDAAARICLFNDFHDFICTARTATTVTGIENYFLSDSFQSIQKFFKQPDVFSLYLYPDEDVLNDTALSKGKYFSVIREIKDYSSDSMPCGYVEVQESVDKIDLIFKDLGMNGYALILDSEKKIVYRSSSLPEAAEGSMLEETVEKIRRGEMVAEFFYQAGHYISYRRVGNTPYTVVFEKSKSTAMELMWNFNILLILSAVIILITVIVTEVLLVRHLSRPLIELNKSIQHVNINSLRMDIKESESTNELQQLKEAFNTVLAKLKDAIDKQYIAKNNELKSHLFALQSQMNPHFLHNILAIIAMETQENQKIQNICSRLCKILSFTSSMNGGLCFLNKEVENAENYMALMKERYEELFEYSINMDKEIAAIRIPKLIVQPICENCFSHGFINKEPLWRIAINAFKSSGKWYIKICDNGQGFSREYLEEYKALQQRITLENLRENMNQISIGGLCVVNIYMRMKICYGDDFTCELYNDDSGAVVLLGGKISD